MDMDKVRELILKVPVIESLPGDLGIKVTDVIVDIGVVRRVAEGQVMTRENKHGKNRGFVLLKGIIGIQKAEVPYTKCRPPELLGEVMQFNPKGMRTATLTAREALEERAWEHFTA
jgi:hypothetical protein